VYGGWPFGAVDEDHVVTFTPPTSVDVIYLKDQAHHATDPVGVHCNVIVCAIEVRCIMKLLARFGPDGNGRALLAVLGMEP
jgi:hypothetical protein